ncbi:hypothetical protein HNY73_010695 [Argiope bruennichi]|uniref:Uncharacterized protein n=1 Tax=Argiope bruennichi TaxID=94029 RepID=A0A8T0F4B5_ARGBR|nr:hypothetical protein HNY73_010695 [Argiope bruennichi]
MAEDKKEKLVIIQGEEPSHMNAIHTIHASNLAGARNWIFSQNYETQSQILETRWRYEMTFSHAPHSEKVSCSFILERKDSVNQPVNVVFRVSFSHENHRLLLNVETFVRDNMLPGDELQGFIAEIITFA